MSNYSPLHALLDSERAGAAPKSAPVAGDAEEEVVLAAPAHTHAHGHGHGHGGDAWNGEEYLARPGLKETAKISAEAVAHALAESGLDDEATKKLSLLEIGAGVGSVTAHFAKAFEHVHAIDTSANMLLTFSTQPVSVRKNVTHTLHALGSDSPAAFARGLPQPSPTEEEPRRWVLPHRERFDVAAANLVVHHVDDLDAFFAGAVGILRDGGRLVVTEFGTTEDGRDPAKEARDEKAQAEGKAPAGTVNGPGLFHHAFSPEQLTALFEKYGLVDVKAGRRGVLPSIVTGREDIPLVWAVGTRKL
ncbi:hypothetical protein Q8F55_000169 [Vanrija albida]|uniref:Methyltransferase type 11 domain-containing protein n=1 Tax=Vanrija albida TaxID=181172 RepID=A0ABR3QCH6_9TREE